MTRTKPRHINANRPPTLWVGGRCGAYAPQYITPISPPGRVPGAAEPAVLGYVWEDHVQPVCDAVADALTAG